MSLLDDLRAAATALDPQFSPSSNEVQGVLGALVHYAEHGQAFLDAAGKSAGDVAELLQPKTEAEAAVAPVVTAPATTPPAGEVVAPEVAAPEASASEVSDTELEARISDLQAQLASRKATSQQTQVTHETGAPPFGVSEPASPSKPESSHLGWLNR